MLRVCGWVIVFALACGPLAAAAAEKTKEEDGKYRDVEGIPTYNIQDDGTVDWYTYNGFRRYHSECHTCHGPDGAGSSYAPALADSMKTMTYTDFMEVVVNGKQQVNAAQNRVMPGFGENLNVMCYLDDIYVYLKARAEGALPRGRPQKREDKPPLATEADNACFGRDS